MKDQPIQLYNANNQTLLLIPAPSRNHRTKEVKAYYYIQQFNGSSKTGLHATPGEALKAINLDPEAKPTSTLDEYLNPQPELT